MQKKKIQILLIEDNPKLNNALAKGLSNTGSIVVLGQFTDGEAAHEFCKKKKPDLILTDVQLEKKWNGIETIVEIRKIYPRLPVLIYSIQDDDKYFRDFRNSGILSHYSYVKKSNYLFPEMILPLIQDACNGRSFIDPEIEERVKEVVFTDQSSPLALLEPIEKQVAIMISKGFSNEQIAKILGYKDKRSISRINGLIYTIWDLREEKTDEAVARTRVALIVKENKLLQWEEDGKAYYKNTNGEWIEWKS